MLIDFDSAVGLAELPVITLPGRKNACRGCQI